MISKIIKSIINKVKWSCEITIFYPLRIFPIHNRKIFICSDYGNKYGDNAKYICKELLLYSYKIDIVWALNDMNSELPKGIRKVKYKSIRYYYEQATAKIWIDNCRKYHYIRKRKGQFYIQTWHGDVGLKKAEGDAAQALGEKYLRDAKNDSKMIDVFVSGNAWMTETIKRAYWYSGKIIEIGSPRRDIFYNASEKDIKAIKRILGIKNEEKIFLYAPTFRVGQDQTSLNVYGLDWQLVKSSLETRFGGEWRGMVRLHPNVAAYIDMLKIPNDVINVTDYPDMQELLLISDCCFSDYSSSLFEFAVTGKPGFIYAEDLEEYKKDRDLNFSLEQIPFSLSQTNEDLKQNILNFNTEEYKKKNEWFYKEKVHLFDNGHASEYIAKMIVKICKNS